MGKLTGIQRLQEVGLLFSAILAFLVLAALTSYHYADPGWSQSGYQEEAQNIMGNFGAMIADISFYFLGYIAYSLPLLISIAAWLMFKKTYRWDRIDYFAVALRIVGFILTLVGLTVLASMNANNIYSYSAGGIVGDICMAFLLPQLNFIGTTVVMLGFLVAGFSLLTGMSWSAVAEHIGLWSENAFHWCRQLPQKLSRKEDTPDTQGFMTIVEKVRQGRVEPQTALGQDADILDLDEDYHDDEEQEEVLAHQQQHSQQAEPQAKTRIEPIVLPNANTATAVSAALSDEKNDAPQSLNETAEIHTIDDAEQQDDDIQSSTFTPVHRSVLNTEILPDTNSEIILDHNNDRNIDHSTESNTELSSEPNTEYHAQSPVDLADNADLPWQQQQSEEVITTAAPLPVLKAKPDLPPLPDINLLNLPQRHENPISDDELDRIAKLVEIKLKEFGVVAEVVSVLPGPVVTCFELDLAPGIKASKVTGLSQDLARSLLAKSVRVVEVIPGKPYIGLELPNEFRETVFMREVLDSDAFHNSKSHLTMVLGKDIVGEPVVADLGKMPHLLVAGTTGSGKSVGVNIMITSLLYKSTPDEVRLILIDPKMLELSVYEGIPHLLCEVVTDMKEDAANALRWCVGEMERRYQLLSAVGVRNLSGYNAKVREAQARGEPMLDPLWKINESIHTQPPVLEPLPSIVVVIDEFADMMMIVGKKVEELIARIAQKARAAGIHLILATQRPSVDVITGLIKANIPTRMAFQVSSKIDSRTILDQQGAETLLGMGDMLYQPPGSNIPLRVHGAFIDDDEVHRVVADWKLRGEPEYIEEIIAGTNNGETTLLPGEVAEGGDDLDPRYDEAVAIVTESGRVSASGLQRRMKVGFNRAARLVEEMEAQGVVSAPRSNGNREVLAPPPVRF